MKTFTDNTGRPWTVEINVAAIKRVRSLVDVNLLEIVEGTLVEKLIRDPVLLCDVVYAVCKPQADAHHPVITDEDFGRAMAGDAIEHATAALLEELVSFCPSPRDRKNLGRVLETTKQVMDRARDVIEAKLDSGELAKAAEQALEELERETPSGSSGSAPASSESTQAPSPSGSSC